MAKTIDNKLFAATVNIKMYVNEKLKLPKKMELKTIMNITSI